MRYLKQLLQVLLIGSLLAFAGCASLQSAKDSASFEKAPDQSGLILLSSTVNTGEINQIHSFVLKKVGKKPNKEFFLSNAIPSHSRDTSLFVGAVPPGEYQFTRLTSGMKVLDLTDAPFLTSVKVGAGDVVDLGRLVLTALNFKVAVGRSRQVTDNKLAIERYLPDKLALYRHKVVAGWTQPPSDKDRVEAFAASHPQGVSSMTELSDGRILAGTRLGTLLVRTPDRIWRIAARTGDHEAIMTTATYETGDNLGVAADNYGELYRLDKRFNLHPIERGDLPRGNVFYIGHSSDFKKWFVALIRDQHAELYTSEKLDGAEWKIVHRNSVANSAWSGARFAWVWDRPSGIGYAVSSDKVVHCYDYNTNAWSQTETPEQRTIIALSAVPYADAVGALTSPGGGFAGVFAKTHLTRDCGSSWTETKSPYKVKASPPILLSDGTIIEAGGVFRDTGIYALKATSKTWEKITDYVVLSERLWVTKSGGIFAVSQGQYGIESISFSSDGGTKWDLELTNYSAEIEKASKKK